MKSRFDYKRELVWAAELSAAYIFGVQKGKEMTPTEQVQFARYKEAVIRSDETISALDKAVTTQREVIDLLHFKIGQLEKELIAIRGGR